MTEISNKLFLKFLKGLIKRLSAIEHEQCDMGTTTKIMALNKELMGYIKHFSKEEK